MNHVRRPRRPLVLGLLIALALPLAALAQIGGDPTALVDQAALAGAPLGEGLFQSEAGLVVEPIVRNGALYAVRAQSVAFDPDVALEAARLIGAASGFGAGIEQPVLDFFAEALPQIAGGGPSVVGIERFRLTLDVTGDAAPYDVTLVLALAEVQDEAFPPARHVKGPADAPIVIRDFSDFSCPACRRFVLEVLPMLESTLLARGDVRIEFHHFPLIGSFPNSFRAAEVAECVADANPERDDAFWTMHDAMYERQAEWSRATGPEPLLLQIARDVDLGTTGVADCLIEGRHVATVQAGYDTAASLQLRGTPTIFVGGFQVDNWIDLGAYQQAIGYLETFGLVELDSGD